MKVAIAGSQGLTDYLWLLEAVERSKFKIGRVLAGQEPHGVDHLIELWARARGIPVDPYPADWNTFGLSAGPLRNGQMSVAADAAIILRLPFSKKSDGSDDLYRKLRFLGKPVYREVLTEAGGFVVA